MNLKYLLYSDGLFMAQYFHFNNFELNQICNIFEKLNPKKGKITKRSIHNYIATSDDLTRLILERFTNEISFSDFFWIVATITFIPFSHLLKILLYATRLFSSRPLTFVQFCQFCAQTGVTLPLGEISNIYTRIVGSVDDNINYPQIVELDKSNPKFFKSLKISAYKYRVLFFSMSTYHIIMDRFARFESIKSYRESHNGICPPQCCWLYFIAPYNHNLYDYSLETFDITTSLGIHIDQVCFSYLAKYKLDMINRNNGVVSIGTGISNLCYNYKSCETSGSSKYYLRMRRSCCDGCNSIGDRSLSSSSNSNFLNNTPLLQQQQQHLYLTPPPPQQQQQSPLLTSQQTLYNNNNNNNLLQPQVTQDDNNNNANSSLLMFNRKKSQIAQYPQSLRSVSEHNTNTNNNNINIVINSKTGTNTTISLSNSSTPISTPTQIVTNIPGLIPSDSGCYVSKYKRCSLEIRNIQQQLQQQKQRKEL